MLSRMLSSLLTRIVVAIVLGALCGLFFPEPIARVFVTFNGVFSGFLGFLIPVLILALVAPAIAEVPGLHASNALVSPDTVVRNHDGYRLDVVHRTVENKAGVVVQIMVRSGRSAVRPPSPERPERRARRRAAPARSAPTPASAAAPAVLGCPPNTHTRPAVPLCASAYRTGSSGATSAGVGRVASACRPAQPGGRRRSASVTSPARCAAGPNSSAGLNPDSVTVQSARRGSPVTSLLRASRPVGRSMASTGTLAAFTPATTSASMKLAVSRKQISTTRSLPALTVGAWLWPA